MIIPRRRLYSKINGDCLKRIWTKKQKSRPRQIGEFRMESLVTANLRQRPLRSLVSVAGVALGVALIMLFTGLARGMSGDLQRRSSNVRAEIIFTRPGALELTSSSANLSTKYVERVQAIEGVE